MKLIGVVLSSILMVACGSQSIRDGAPRTYRQIAYVEQEQPGALIVLTLTDTRQAVGGSIMDVEVGMRDNRFSVDPSIFQRVWSLVESPEMARYRFQPSESANMAAPDYYTISKKFGTRTSNFRIPLTEGNSVAVRLIDTLKEIIADNS